MKLIDLSHTLDNSTPSFPGDAELRLERYRRLEADHYNAFLLSTGLHTGTHIDLPMHLLEDGRTAADFPPGAFCGRGVLVDAAGQNPIALPERLKTADLSGTVLVIHTGFSASFRDPRYFTDYPPLSEEFAEFLLHSGIKMLGIDTPSPDHPPYTLHKRLLAAGIFLLENLTNLEALAGLTDFEIMALPLKIAAEGSPVRAVAVLR